MTGAIHEGMTGGMAGTTGGMPLKDRLAPGMAEDRGMTAGTHAGKNHAGRTHAGTHAGIAAANLSATV